MQSGMFAQRLEQHGDVGHLIGPFGTMPIPANRRTREGIQLLLPPTTAVVILIGGRRGDRYTVSLTLSGPDNEPIPFPVQHKTWPNKPHHRIVLRTEGVPVFFRDSGIWRIAVLINGEPAGELLLPIFWDDETPPALPD